MTREEAIKQLQGMLVGADWLSNHMIVALSMAIEALTAQQWIPVSDRLPNCMEYVLVTEKDGRVYKAFMDDLWIGDTVKTEWHDGDLNVIEPTAWMPLPEPYKGE